MRFITSFIVFVTTSIVLAQEPPVVKAPSKNDDEKAKLKSLIFELDNEENDVKLKLAHKKECEKIIKDNCFVCHNYNSKNGLVLFDEDNILMLKEKQEQIVKFITDDKNFESCKKLEEKTKTRLLKFFETK
jgi:hypothetical protein